MKPSINRCTFENQPKGSELWKDKTPQERLAGLERLRQIHFKLAELGKNGKSNT
jgi:hypothetical protein